MEINKDESESSIVSNVSNSIVGLNIVSGANVTVENVKIIIDTNGENKNDLFDLEPPKPIKTFKGRDKEIATLERIMFHEDQKKIVIYGLPGMGKTELANQFANKCRDEGKVTDIFWINAEEIENVNKAFNSLAEKYQIHETNKRRKLKLIYDKLKHNNYLFVFDNCEEDDKIEEFLPPDEFYLLITSKVQEWSEDFQTILLEELSLDASLLVSKSILSKHYKLEFLDQYKQLADFVSNVPLGLQIVFCNIKRAYDQGQRRFDFDCYFKRLNSQDDVLDLEIHKIFKNPYKKSIYKAVYTSVINIFEDHSQMQNIRELSKLILCVSSFLDPDTIYFQLLKYFIGSGKINNSIYEECDFETALYSISNYNILKYLDTDTSLKIHRLVQKILRYYFKRKNYEIYSTCFIIILQLQPITSEEYDDEDDSITVISYEYYCLHFMDINLDILKIFYAENMSKNLDKYTNFLKTLAKYGCIESMKYIFNYEDTSKSELIYKHSLLHGAIEGNNIKMLKFLLENYEDINRHYGRESVLHVAAHFSNLSALEICIANKADVFIKNKVQETPLFEFCRFLRDTNKNIENFLDLLRCEESKEILNHRHASVLHAACSGYCNDHLINLLINKYQYNVNKQDKFGNTPLHYLYFNENRNTERRKLIVKLFEEGKADFSIKNNFGKTCSEMSHCDKLFENVI